MLQIQGKIILLINGQNLIKPTIISEFYYKIFELNGKFSKIQLWEMAGQDQNICVIKIFSKDVNVIMFYNTINEKFMVDYLRWKNILTNKLYNLIKFLVF